MALPTDHGNGHAAYRSLARMACVYADYFVGGTRRMGVNSEKRNRAFLFFMMIR